MVHPFPEEYRPLRRVEYDRLISLGVFEDEKIELLDGVLVPMSPIGTRHCAAIDMLTLLFVRALGDRARIRVQNSFAAGDISEPEPDIVIAPLADYTEEHPDEAYLVVEVAESSLSRDRGVKRRIYAEQRVAEYWIVDVAARRIEVYCDPADRSFREARVYSHGETIELRRFPDVKIRVADIIKW